MNSIIKQLYYGGIAPEQQINPRTPEYRKLVQHSEELLKRINEELPASHRELLDELCSTHYAEAAIEAEFSFSHGMSLGILLMTEVFADSGRLRPWLD